MKALAINVAANTSTPGGRGPIYEDGSFRFVPITERDSSVQEPTYEDLGLEDVRPESARDTVAHFDPEFRELDYGENYTYGDRWNAKTSQLKKLEEGDLLLFYATLDYEGTKQPEHPWINTDWGAYVVGQFELALLPVDADDLKNVSGEIESRLKSNAHFRRDEFDADILVLGNPDGSELYDLPVPLSGSNGTEANSIVTGLSEDSGKGPWYRRPIWFDENATTELLSLRETGDFGEVEV